MGAHVTCVDVDEQKIQKLKDGIMPIYEPGLEELVKRNVGFERLKFTTDLTDVLDDVEVVFIAMDECKRRIGDVVIYCNSMYDAADGADVFALITEWHQFRMPSWNVIKKVMNGNVIVDGRNIYDRAELEEHGFIYTRIG